MPERDLVREWALVLESQGIEAHIARQPDGWELVVHPRDADRAAQALDAYARENAARERATVPDVWPMRPHLPLLTALLMLAFHAASGPWAAASRWFDAGAANAALIRQGEWWRTVTALTLHADLGHVMANAVSLVLFGTAVASVFGSGLGMLLVLWSGAAGNAVNAWLRWHPYGGVGASTAVFGALGLLVGAQVARPRPGQGRRFTALVSGVLLLVLLGMGEHTDVVAHVLGFCAGLATGAAVAGRVNRASGTPAQAAWALAAAALVAGCWWLALGDAGGLQP